MANLTNNSSRWSTAGLRSAAWIPQKSNTKRKKPVWGRSENVESCPFAQPTATTLASANEDSGEEGNPLPLAFESSVDRSWARRVGHDINYNLYTWTWSWTDDCAGIAVIKRAIAVLLLGNRHGAWVCAFYSLPSVHRQQSFMYGKKVPDGLRMPVHQ